MNTSHSVVAGGVRTRGTDRITPGRAVSGVWTSWSSEWSPERTLCVFSSTDGTTVGAAAVWFAARAQNGGWRSMGVQEKLSESVSSVTTSSTQSKTLTHPS